MNKWLDDYNQQTILLINLVLNNDTQPQTQTTEYCAAFLFSTSGRELNKSKHRLFRVFSTEQSNLVDDFPCLLDSEQVDKQTIRHIWACDLSKPAVNTLKTATFDNELMMDPNNFHQMDNHFGKLNSSHGWLALAFASDAITHGQKAQIVVTQKDDKIELLQLSHKSNDIEYTPSPSFGYPFAYLMSVSLFLLSLIFLIPSDDIPWGTVVLFGSVFLF